MRFTAVESTVLARAGYDEDPELLQLEFCSRAIYCYFGVPAAVHQALLVAPSKGIYFNQAIRGRFPFCRICEGNVDAPDAAMPVGCRR